MYVPTLSNTNSSLKHQHPTGTRLNTVKSVYTRSMLQIDHHDPEWYNTYEKHSLFQTLQRWIDDFVLIWKRRWIEAPPSSEEILSSNTLNARFDLFAENCNTVYGDKLGALIYSKLYPPASSFETPWRKVFVKDDNGCNGVGMLVIGREDVSETEPFRLKLSDRKTLRPRNKNALERRLVLQEGVPTCLRNQDTGAQLEIVLMFANGHVYNYFAREIDSKVKKESSSSDSSKEKETKGRIDEDDDTCTSLNIPGARFIQRDVFETSPKYRDAFERVRKQWWKYVRNDRALTHFLVQLLYSLASSTSLRTPLLSLTCNNTTRMLRKLEHQHRYSPEDCVF